MPSEDATLDTLQGTLDLLVLRALKWGPRHGYAVAQCIDGLVRMSAQGADQ